MILICSNPRRRTVLAAVLSGVLLAWITTIGAVRAQDPVPVRTAPLRSLLVDREHSVPAQVEALNRSRLSAELNARVESIPVRIGDAVDRGTVLVRLDCRQQRSVLAAARAARDEIAARQRFAEQQVARASDLQKNRNISEELVQQRRSELAVLEAQARTVAETERQAGLQVSRCEIRAPYAAWVVERLVGEGELATPGQQLLELVQRDAAEVSAAVRDDDAQGLLAAQSLWFVYAGRRLPLRLRQLLPVVEGIARTREARLEFREAAQAPGVAGRLAWRPPVTAVGAEYLVRRGRALGVFVVENAAARFVALPDAVEGQPAAVDLAPETAVVTDGRHRLQDGDPVQVR